MIKCIHLIMFPQVVYYRSTWDLLLTITSQEGALAWYKGFSPALLKSALVSGLTFVTYELACQGLLNWRGIR